MIHLGYGNLQSRSRKGLKVDHKLKAFNSVHSKQAHIK